VDVITLLDALAEAGLPEAILDVVATAVGDAPDVSLGSLRGLLTGWVGAAAAARIVSQLVSMWRDWSMRGWIWASVTCDACPPCYLVGCRAPLASESVVTLPPCELQRRPEGGR
jgi:hypothetical protein